MCIFSFRFALREAIARGAHRIRKEFRASPFCEPQALTALPRLAVCHIAVIVLLPRPRLHHIPLPSAASR